MSRTKLALALSLIGASVPASLLVSPVPLSAQPGTNVNGMNVTAVRFAGGYYARMGDKQWVETDRTERPQFRFVEVSRDERSVYLNDPSRNVQIQIDLYRRKISYGTNGGPRTDLYDIIEAYPAPSAAAPNPSPTQAAPPQTTAPRGRTRLVNAGPIWDQKDAQMKCPVVAYAVNGRWTGQWKTVRNGEMSVCEIAR